jgi:CDP-2,3-bis-(O-geranylgeranyl)-sn-glycerol synthase
MTQDILFALWLFWPAGLATLFPVLAAHTPGLRSYDAPIDRGRTWRGRRLLGDHKTWRGFLAGWIAGSAWTVVQTWWFHHSSFVRDLYPSGFNPDLILVTGILISLGAVVGDALGSFFKRQLDIQSGQSWFPWDQLDFILGGIAFSLLAVRLSLLEYVFIAVVWLVVHLIFGVLGYLTNTKKSLI